MRRLLSLKEVVFAIALEQGGAGRVSYFFTFLGDRDKSTEEESAPVVVDLGNPEDAAWLERVRGHYKPLGFTVMDPDEDGHVQVRFYPNPENVPDDLTPTDA